MEQASIAKGLNTGQVETWGQGKRKGQYWHSSYVQKLLTNPAAVGTFVPHRVSKTDKGRQRTPEDPITNYWPCVVDREVFERVSAMAQTRAARGRHADQEPKNVFAGLLRCAQCGGSVVRVSKGAHVYLICSRAHQRAGCRYLAVRYPDVEERLVEVADALVSNAPRGSDTTDLDGQIERLANGTWVLADQARELADIAANEKSSTARRLLRAKEEELEEAEQTLRTLRSRRDALTSADSKAT